MALSEALTSGSGEGCFNNPHHHEECKDEDEDPMQVVRKQDNLKMEGDFERPPTSAWQVANHLTQKM